MVQEGAFVPQEGFIWRGTGEGSVRGDAYKKESDGVFYRR